MRGRYEPLPWVIAAGLTCSAVYLYLLAGLVRTLVAQARGIF